MFYALTLLASVVSLSLWYFLRNKRKLAGAVRMLFFSALGLYVLSMLFSSGSWELKWGVLARDLAWLAVIPAALSLLANRRSAFMLLLGIAALATGFMASKTQFIPESMDELENEWELLLELSEDSDVRVIQKVVDKYDLFLEPAFKMENESDTELDDYYAVEIPEQNESLLREIQDALSNAKGVDWVEDNESVSVAPIESRKLPPVNNKYKINDPDLQNQWAYASLEVNKLYDLLRNDAGKPTKKASIYILDTGVDGQHEDLKSQFFSTKSKYNKDVRGHGTHCAGIAAAVSNNGVGVASLSPDRSYISVTSIKVLSDYGVGNQRGIINGILEAADAGADVISMSLGGRSNASSQRAYTQAVDYARKAGAIVVAAAGNDGGMARDIAPANVPGLITVSAVDTLLDRASFSNSVAGLKMGVAAPGVSIFSTLPGNKYGALSGTSMATPFVAGLVGLLRSFDPDMNTEQAYQILSQTGRTTKRPVETGPLVQPDAALFFLLENR